MTESEYFFMSSSDAYAEDLEQVHSRLLAYNDAHAGPAGFKKVGLLLRDASGVVRAGLIGKHIWGRLSQGGLGAIV